MGYKMTLIVGGKEINIPVLPKKLTVSSPGTNDKLTVLETGEVLILRKKGLRTVSWDSFFPAASAPYTTGSVGDPLSIVQAIQKARDQRKSIRFLITGTDLDCNIRMGVDTFEYEERSGELGDFYYSLKLTEWKNYAPKRITLTEPAATKEATRAGEPETSKTHTVVKGDCLWAIAQAYYGDGSRYPEIYAANKAAIDARNAGTGNPKYTIYPGQVFTIP